MRAKEFGLLGVRVLALTVLLMMVNGFASGFLPEMPTPGASAEASGGPSVPSGSFMAIVFGVMFLQTHALAHPIVRSKWYGWKLTFTTFLLFFGTTTFMGQIESLVYLGGKMPEGMLLGLFAMGFVSAAVFSPIAVFSLKKWELHASDPPPRHNGSMSAGRITLAALVFLALYYSFGYYVAWKNPEVREYYNGTDPGSFIAQMKSVVQGTPWMVPFQYVRGLLWVGLALLVIRMMKGPWWEAGIAVSVLFTVPSFYLLLPNPLMPDPVRMAHLVETAPYQFLFGWFAAWLFRPREANTLSADT